MYNYFKPLVALVLSLFCMAVGIAAQTSASQTPTPKPVATAVATSAVQAPANPYKGKFLFGDWSGSRLKMAQKGVNFDISLTQFGQTISGDKPDSFDYYGNHVDVFINIDTEKAGMWKGGGIATHAEYRYGTAPRGVTLFPTNTALFTPLSGERKVVFTSLYLTQKIGATTVAMFGKINPIDLLAASPFIGGRGVDGFMNIGFVAPPSGVTPVSTYGVLFKGVVKKKYGLSLFIFDPADQTAWNKPFPNGVNFNVGAVIPGKINGQNSTHSFSATVSTSKGTNLSNLPQLILPPGQRQIGTKRGAFNIGYQFEQYFKQNPTNPGQGWGMFAKFAIADGNPNAIQNSIHVGIAGTGVAKSRPLDRFGFGFYTYGLSDALKDSLRPIVKLQRESGAEAFYNLAVTPWLRVTGDLQVLPPTVENKDTRVYFAVRTKISF
jgi:porin